MLDFLHEKFGDIVALTVLFTGVGIVLLSPASKDTGSGLIMAALGLLKLTKTYKTNGNGNGVTAISPSPEVPKEDK